MKRAIVFANGRVETTPPIIREICSSDLIIAADGGAEHCKRLGILPNLIIGDLDSMDEKTITVYREAGVEIIRHPRRKDETDLELALKIAVQRSISQVYIIGGLGIRWDMTFANVLLAAHPAYPRLSIRFLDGSQELVVLSGTNRLDMDDRRGNTVSLIPLGGDVLGVTTEGLEYSLKDEILYFGSPRGVSNVIAEAHAQVRMRAGTLLCCLMNGEEH